MGRGRQKAKHTKVARELKYFSPDVDLTALERELAAPADEDELIDKWADLFPDEDDSAEAADGETGETVAELEDVVETEDVDEVADQLGDVDDDGASER
ncbi:MAG: hypothetical protein RL009_656 [Actinomycetota bacterium]|jgi:hypothetical protein